MAEEYAICIKRDADQRKKKFHMDEGKSLRIVLIGNDKYLPTRYVCDRKNPITRNMNFNSAKMKKFAEQKRFFVESAQNVPTTLLQYPSEDR